MKPMLRRLRVELLLVLCRIFIPLDPLIEHGEKSNRQILMGDIKFRVAGSEVSFAEVGRSGKILHAEKSCIQ